MSVLMLSCLMQKISIGFRLRLGAVAFAFNSILLPAKISIVHRFPSSFGSCDSLNTRKVLKTAYNECGAAIIRLLCTTICLQFSQNVGFNSIFDLVAKLGGREEGPRFYEISFNQFYSVSVSGFLQHLSREAIIVILSRE